MPFFFFEALVAESEARSDLGRDWYMALRNGPFIMVLVVALTLIVSSQALAQLAKEGTEDGWYSGFGTVKLTSVGKERVLMSWDENGITVSDGGKGLMHQMTWHCWGLVDFTKGAGSMDTGYCVGTDPAGDQLVGNLKDSKHAMDAKSWEGTYTFTTGTGKFAGVRGGGTYVIQGTGFRPAAEGTYHSYNRYQDSWTLP
jgi:hypothetical protein